jgi:two-component system NtrC family sensor kinase
MAERAHHEEIEEMARHYAALRREILTSMIVIPLIPFVLALLTGFYYFTRSLQTDTESKTKRIVEDHSHMIDSFLRERLGDLRLIMDAYGYHRLRDQPTLEQVFANLQGRTNAFVDLGVFDEAGVHVAYHGDYQLVGKVYREASWFKEVMTKGHYISDVFLGYRKTPHFIVALSQRRPGQTWVIRATIDSQLFNNRVENIRIGRTGEAYILNRDGLFQTQRRSGGRLMERDPDAATYLVSHEGTRTFVAENSSGKRFLYATVWLQEKDWLLVARQAEADAFQALRRATYLVALIVLIGWIAIVSTASVVTRRIVRRLEQKDAEKAQLINQLIVAGRLAELGEMSAGFAHEINNPLQIIRAEQALMETILSEMRDRGEGRPSDELVQMFDSIHQIRAQVDRCAQITRGVLNFARQEETVIRSCDLRTFVPDVVGLVERKAGVSGILMVQKTSETVPLIRADAGQLQQVLLNLFNNAIDAIAARHGGAVGEILIGARSSGDGWVELSVTDNGCGISPENLGRVFTPFFTTKPVGKGTGLGLSVCYGIVKAMGGTIGVSSRLGEGTTFTIRLPSSP